MYQKLETVWSQYCEQYNIVRPDRNIFSINFEGVFCKNTYLCEVDEIKVETIVLGVFDTIRFSTETHGYEIILNWLQDEPEPFVESITRQKNLELLYYDGRIGHRRHMK